MELEDKWFIDWESEVFGYGYGSGEPHTIRALCGFLTCCNKDGTYDYQTIESHVGLIGCWLLINILAKEDIIEYGTSPRYGWLTKKGLWIKNYAETRGFPYIVDAVCSTDENYCFCSKDHCNCDKDCTKTNPLFKD